MIFFLVLVVTYIDQGLGTPSFHLDNKSGRNLASSLQAVDDDVKTSLLGEAKTSLRAFPDTSATHPNRQPSNLQDDELRPLLHLLVHQLQELRQLCKASEGYVKQLMHQLREEFTTQLRREVEFLNVQLRDTRKEVGNAAPKSVDKQHDHKSGIEGPCDRRCPEGFLSVGEECFYVHHHSPLPWHDARAFCQNKLGADLAVPEDVLRLREFLLKYGHTKNFWLGASDEFVEGDFRWLSGHQVNQTTAWRFGYPGDFNVEENCVHFGAAYEMFLNVAACLHAKHFICEA